MSVKIISTPLRITAFLSGEIDHHNAVHIRESIDDAVEKKCPKILRIDFSDVTFMDSSGVGLVMGRYKKIKDYGGKIELINMSQYIYKVMKLSGIEKIANIIQKEMQKK
ncbi:MAG TPA: anti-sigma factor antagonist [Clostridia bacterium]|nr:anti-sigma factor antagonist [Clostridia bacterium]